MKAGQIAKPKTPTVRSVRLEAEDTGRLIAQALVRRITDHELNGKRAQPVCPLEGRLGRGMCSGQLNGGHDQFGVVLSGRAIG